jgi:hypothetical protein
MYVNPNQMKEFLELLEDEGQSGQVVISITKGKINHIDIKDSHDPKSFSYYLDRKKKHKPKFYVKKSVEKQKESVQKSANYDQSVIEEVSKDKNIIIKNENIVKISENTLTTVGGGDCENSTLQDMHSQAQSPD